MNKTRIKGANYNNNKNARSNRMNKFDISRKMNSNQENKPTFDVNMSLGINFIKKIIIS